MCLSKSKNVFCQDKRMCLSKSKNVFVQIESYIWPNGNSVLNIGRVPLTDNGCSDGWGTGHTPATCSDNKSPFHQLSLSSSNFSSHLPIIGSISQLFPLLLVGLATYPEVRLARWQILGKLVWGVGGDLSFPHFWQVIIGSVGQVVIEGIPARKMLPPLSSLLLTAANISKLANNFKKDVSL